MLKLAKFTKCRYGNPSMPLGRQLGIENRFNGTHYRRAFNQRSFGLNIQ
jgi:hypothetical protein